MEVAQATNAWLLFVSIAAGIGTIVAFIKGVQYLFEMTPVSRLEKRVKTVEEHDSHDFEKFKELERRMDDLERKLNESDNKINRIDEGVQRLGKSQILLLRHFATGNGQKEMAEEADDLTEYFIDRR